MNWIKRIAEVLLLFALLMFLRWFAYEYPASSQQLTYAFYTFLTMYVYVSVRKRD